MKTMNIEDVFRKVLDCSFKIHTSLGPGLLESVHFECSIIFNIMDVQKFSFGALHNLI
ncbi:MAG: hypothetical protein IPN67_17955 [Bacteroidales bacterium]|nr:hypothetical protein [Bacteroidales bacterium]MBK8884172.1 hypothetical protein [Bacteroidales bacterium]